MERDSRGKYPNANTVVTSINPQPVVATLQEQYHKGVANKVIPPNMPATVTTTSSASSSTRWPGERKEALTKEQMEGINKCNPS